MTTDRDKPVRNEDPYCWFNDDQERRAALVSMHQRDITIAKSRHWRAVVLGAFLLIYQLAEIVGRLLL